MPELDVGHFRKDQEELAVLDSDSVEAPSRPSALDTPQDQNDLTEVVDGEVLPSTLPVPIAPVSSLSPFQRIDFLKIESRRQLMSELNSILPLNEFNLPRYFYRADLLDFHRLADLRRDDSETQLQETLESATVMLDYHHGYPTLDGGMPFWTQLGYESTEAYGAFALYVEQAGARTFVGMTAYDPALLAEWFHTYCWMYRAKAYDMFRITHHSRMRMHRIMDTEDNHYLESQKIYARLIKAFGGKTQEELAAMEPNDLINALEKVVKIQRVSAGLPASGAPESARNEHPLSVEVQMRQIAKSDGTHQVNEEDHDTFALLQNPDALKSAQELIIKIGGGGTR